MRRQSMEGMAETDNSAAIERLQIILGVVEKMISRHSSIDDPVLRSMLLMDKFFIIIDMLMAFATMFEDVPSSLRDRLKKVECDITNEMNHVVNWIRSPQYSPDHPFGERMKEEAENDFVTKCVSADSKNEV